jgi:hypothetical protein
MTVHSGGVLIERCKLIPKASGTCSSVSSRAYILQINVKLKGRGQEEFNGNACMLHYTCLPSRLSATGRFGATPELQTGNRDEAFD